MATLKISAIPFEHFDSFNRAGKRWSREPREVTVREPKPGEVLGENEISPTDLEALRKEPRIKIEGDSGAPAPSAAPPAPAPEPMKKRGE